MKQSVKIFLLLAFWTVLLFALLKLQNDYALDTNILHFNKKNLKFDNKIKITRTTINLKTKLPNINRNICNISRPNYPDLQFDNIYWQTLNLTNSNGNIKLFRAFYDDRKQSKIGPSIRILAMINPFEFEMKHIKNYCQFWFNKIENPIISKIIEYKRIWHYDWDKLYAPFLLTCPYNFNQYHKIPEAVSIVNQKCNQTDNYIKIINNRPNLNTGKKLPFGVCVKDFNFNDQNVAIRIIEWIELIRILGAAKIFIYQFQATGNILKVFDYYENNEIIEIIKITYPKTQSLKSQINDNELISLNDCFYRNIYLYDYIAIIDIDEIIIPKHQNDITWLDMLQRIKYKYKLKYDSYIFRNVYFLDNFQHNFHYFDIPNYLYILQHINRSICYTPINLEAQKTIYNTELVKIVYNHYPLNCFHNDEKCISLHVKTKFGHLAHYRQTPPDNQKKYCNLTVKDKSIWKYKDDLIKQVKKIVNMLEL